MSKLYSDLARIYHEMYQSIFNYEKEFLFYDTLLKKYACNLILEIGCGSGNLCKYFKDANYSYMGLDLYDEMLQIARELNPSGDFIQGDMRNLNFTKKYDAIIITGRSFAYMMKNDDVNSALISVNKTLKSEGILIFDNFNAKEIFLNFKQELIQTSTYNNRNYKRVSNNSMNLETGWTWNWDATYYIEESGEETQIVHDKSVLRAFTKDELSLFLKMNNFDILKIIDEGSSLTVVARKVMKSIKNFT